MPEEIYQADQEFYTLNQNLQDALANSKAIESKLITEIAREVDNGKPKFPNEQARSAELVGRKLVHPDMIKIDEVVTDLSEKVAQAKQRQALLTNRFSAARHLSELYASYLRTRAT